MTHIVNIFRIVTLSIIMWIFQILGFVILPIAVLFRKSFIADNDTSNPAEKFSCKLIDLVYSNEEDGFADIYYRRDFPKDTYWSRLNWCMLRNPVHNLGKALGVRNKKVIAVINYGNQNVTDDPFDKNTGMWYREVITEDRKMYPMYYYTFLWRQIIPFYNGNRGLRLLAGWKNFNVKELDVVYDYSMTLVVTPFKMFVKG